MKKAVVNGAILTCTLAQTPDQGKLIVLASRKCAMSGAGLGIVSDIMPITVIPSMGTCTIISGGNPGPCIPAPSGNWSPGAVRCKCEGTALIQESDILQCGIGGTISISNAGQTKMEIV